MICKALFTLNKLWKDVSTNVEIPHFEKVVPLNLNVYNYTAQKNKQRITVYAIMHNY